jgi:hypothetical protein
MPDVPDLDYRVSCKVRMAIRFDELGAARPLQKKADAQNAQRTTRNLQGVQDPRGDLKLVQDADAPPGVQRLILLSTSSLSQIQSSNSQALQQPSSGFQRISTRLPTRSQDKLTFDVVVLPIELTWKKNGIREADHLQFKILFGDFPFDPRMCRSVGLECVMGVVTEDDYAAGVNGEYRQLPGGEQESRSFVPDTYTDDQGRTRTNVRFQGFADTWENEWNGEGATITIEGRDNTQLLIDQGASPKLVLDMQKPLHVAVAQMLAHYPQMEGMSVEYQPPGETPPVLKSALANTAHRPNLGPQPSKGTDKLSVWDYITDVCGAVGHSCRVDGTRVIVQRVRSFMTSQVVRRPDDPYVGRTGPDGKALPWRRFYWGRNLAEMKTKRKFVPTNTGQNVEMRCWSVAQKKLLVARFPEDNDRNAYALPGDATDQKWVTHRVSGIEDVTTLKRVAQEYYESQGRNEIEVELHTSDLCSYAGTSNDPDILDATAGDTIEVMPVADDAEEDVNDQTKLATAFQSAQRAKQKILDLGFSEDFAKAFATASQAAAFVTQFRLKTIEAKWSTDGSDGGIELTIGGVNYLEVREDKIGTDIEQNNNPNAPAPQTFNNGPPGDLPPVPGAPSTGFI